MLAVPSCMMVLHLAKFYVEETYTVYTAIRLSPRAEVEQHYTSNGINLFYLICFTQ